jgi:hypothetical protein
MPEGVDFFEKKIRPLLVDRCYRCHSSQAAKLKGGLRLDTPDGIRKGGNSGPAIAPGDPEQSLLIKAVRYTDPDLRMPPTKKLSPEEVANLEVWVKSGSPTPLTDRAGDRLAGDVQSAAKHWAFVPPKEPLVPLVKFGAWVKNAIDRFILAKLEARGLRPAASADKRMLLRRVTYDLTGLPPTPQTIDAFLADNSPDAFARVVDRLLASPHYGDCWGRHWLDLARYTDDFDEAWRYRDWVVRAFNRDLPYDQFIVQQIAGDRLLPNAECGMRNAESKTRKADEESEPVSAIRNPHSEFRIGADGIVATTLLSLGPWGGIDRKKRMADIVDDQIDTIGRSFLGLTLACARCHNHKFDPITSADYYGLAGIFYSSRVISDTVYLSHGTTRLRVPLVPAAEVDRHRQQMDRVHALEKKLASAIEEQYAAFAKSLVPQTARYLIAAWEFENRPPDQANLTAEEFATRRGVHGFALAQWIGYLGGTPLGDFRLLHRPVRDYDGEAGIQVWGAHAERPWWGVNPTDREVPIETFLLPARTASVNPGVEGGAVGWKSPITGRVRIQGRLVDADPHDGSGVAWIVDHAGASGRRELSSGDLPNGGVLRLDEGRTPERLAAVDVKAGDVIYLQVWLREGDAHYDITNVELTITRLDGPGEWDLVRDGMSHFLEGNPHRDSLGNAKVWGYYDMAGSHRRGRMPALEPLLKAWQKMVADNPKGEPGRKAIERVAHEFQAAIEKAGADGPLVQALTGVRSPFWVRARDDGKYLSSEGQKALAKLTAEFDILNQSIPPLPCAHGIEEGGPRFSLFPGIGDVRIHMRGSYERLGERVPRHFPRVLAGDRQPTITSGSGRLELARWIGSAENPLTARVLVNRLWQHHFGEGIVRTPSNFGRLGSPPSHPELLDWLARRFVESGWSIKALHRLILLSAAYQQASQVSPEMLRADPDNLLFGRMNRRRLEAEALHDSLLSVCGRLDDRQGGPADDPQSPRRMLYLKVARADRSGFGSLFDAANASMHVEKRTSSTVSPQALYLMNGSLVMDGVQHLVSRPEVARGKPEERVQALYRLVFGRKATAEEVTLGCRFIERQASESKVAPAAGATSLSPWETYAQALLLSNEFLFVD